MQGNYHLQQPPDTPSLPPPKKHAHRSSPHHHHRRRGVLPRGGHRHGGAQQRGRGGAAAAPGGAQRQQRRLAWYCHLHTLQARCAAGAAGAAGEQVRAPCRLCCWGCSLVAGCWVWRCLPSAVRYHSQCGLTPPAATCVCHRRRHLRGAHHRLLPGCSRGRQRRVDRLPEAGGQAAACVRCWPASWPVWELGPA